MVHLASCSSQLQFHSCQNVPYKLTHQIQLSKENSYIQDINWSCDGARLAVIPYNDSSAVYRVKNMLMERYCELGELGHLQTAAFQRSNSRSLTVAPKDPSVLLIDVDSKVTQTFCLDSAVRYMDWSANDKYLAMSTPEGPIAIYTTENRWEKIEELPYYFKVSALRCHNKEEDFLGIGSTDGQVALYSMFFDKNIFCKPIHSQEVKDLAFFPDAHNAFASVGGKQLTIYDISTNRRAVAHVHSKDPLTTIDIASDGVSIAVGSTTGKISLYDLRNGKSPVAVMPSHSPECIHRLRYQPALKDVKEGHVEIKKSMFSQICRRKSGILEPLSEESEEEEFDDLEKISLCNASGPNDPFGPFKLEVKQASLDFSSSSSNKSRNLNSQHRSHTGREHESPRRNRQQEYSTSEHETSESQSKKKFGPPPPFFPAAPRHAPPDKMGMLMMIGALTGRSPDTFLNSEPKDQTAPKVTSSPRRNPQSVLARVKNEEDMEEELRETKTQSSIYIGPTRYHPPIENSSSESENLCDTGLNNEDEDEIEDYDDMQEFLQGFTGDPPQSVLRSRQHNAHIQIDSDFEEICYPKSEYFRSSKRHDQPSQKDGTVETKSEQESTKTFSPARPRIPQADDQKMLMFLAEFTGQTPESLIRSRKQGKTPPIKARFSSDSVRRKPELELKSDQFEPSKREKAEMKEGDESDKNEKEEIQKFRSESMAEESGTYFATDTSETGNIPRRQQNQSTQKRKSLEKETEKEFPMVKSAEPGEFQADNTDMFNFLADFTDLTPETFLRSKQQGQTPPLVTSCPENTNSEDSETALTPEDLLFPVMKKKKRRETREKNNEKELESPKTKESIKQDPPIVFYEVSAKPCSPQTEPHPVQVNSVSPRNSIKSKIPIIQRKPVGCTIHPITTNGKSAKTFIPTKPDKAQTKDTKRKDNNPAATTSSSGASKSKAELVLTADKFQLCVKVDKKVEKANQEKEKEKYSEESILDIRVSEKPKKQSASHTDNTHYLESKLPTRSRRRDQPIRNRSLSETNGKKSTMIDSPVLLKMSQIQPRSKSVPVHNTILPIDWKNKNPNVQGVEEGRTIINLDSGEDKKSEKKEKENIGLTRDNTSNLRVIERQDICNQPIQRRKSSDTKTEEELTTPDLPVQFAKPVSSQNNSVSKYSTRKKPPVLSKQKKHVKNHLGRSKRTPSELISRRQRKTVQKFMSSKTQTERESATISNTPGYGKLPVDDNEMLLKLAKFLSKYPESLLCTTQTQTTPLITTDSVEDKKTDRQIQTTPSITCCVDDISSKNPEIVCTANKIKKKVEQADKKVEGEEKGESFTRDNASNVRLIQESNTQFPFHTNQTNYVNNQEHESLLCTTQTQTTPLITTDSVEDKKTDRQIQTTPSITCCVDDISSKNPEIVCTANKIKKKVEQADKKVEGEEKGESFTRDNASNVRLIEESNTQFPFHTSQTNYVNNQEHKSLLCTTQTQTTPLITTDSVEDKKTDRQIQTTPSITCCVDDISSKNPEIVFTANKIKKEVEQVDKKVEGEEKGESFTRDNASNVRLIEEPNTQFPFHTSQTNYVNNQEHKSMDSTREQGSAMTFNPASLGNLQSDDRFFAKLVNKYPESFLQNTQFQTTPVIASCADEINSNYPEIRSRAAQLLTIEGERSEVKKEKEVNKEQEKEEKTESFTRDNASNVRLMEEPNTQFSFHTNQTNYVSNQERKSAGTKKGKESTVLDKEMLSFLAKFTDEIPESLLRSKQLGATPPLITSSSCDIITKNSDTVLTSVLTAGQLQLSAIEKREVNEQQKTREQSNKYQPIQQSKFLMPDKSSTDKSSTVYCNSVSFAYNVRHVDNSLLSMKKEKREIEEEKEEISTKESTSETRVTEELNTQFATYTDTLQNLKTESPTRSRSSNPQAEEKGMLMFLAEITGQTPESLQRSKQQGQKPSTITPCLGDIPLEVKIPEEVESYSELIAIDDINTQFTTHTDTTQYLETQSSIRSLAQETPISTHDTTSAILTDKTVFNTSSSSKENRNTKSDFVTTHTGRTEHLEDESPMCRKQRQHQIKNDEVLETERESTMIFNPFRQSELRTEDKGMLMFLAEFTGQTPESLLSSRQQNQAPPTITSCPNDIPKVVENCSEMRMFDKMNTQFSTRTNTTQQLETQSTIRSQTQKSPIPKRESSETRKKFALQFPPRDTMPGIVTGKNPVITASRSSDRNYRYPEFDFDTQFATYAGTTQYLEIESPIHSKKQHQQMKKHVSSETKRESAVTFDPEAEDKGVPMFLKAFTDQTSESLLHRRQHNQTPLPRRSCLDDIPEDVEIPQEVKHYSNMSVFEKINRQFATHADTTQYLKTQSPIRSQTQETPKPKHESSEIKIESTMQFPPCNTIPAILTNKSPVITRNSSSTGNCRNLKFDFVSDQIKLSTRVGEKEEKNEQKKEEIGSHSNERISDRLRSLQTKRKSSENISDGIYAKAIQMCEEMNVPFGTSKKRYLETESPTCSKQQTQPTRKNKLSNIRIKRKSAIQFLPFNPAEPDKAKIDDKEHPSENSNAFCGGHQIQTIRGTTTCPGTGDDNYFKSHFGLTNRQFQFSTRVGNEDVKQEKSEKGEKSIASTSKMRLPTLKLTPRTGKISRLKSESQDKPTQKDTSKIETRSEFTMPVFNNYPAGSGGYQAGDKEMITFLAKFTDTIPKTLLQSEQQRQTPLFSKNPELAVKASQFSLSRSDEAKEKIKKKGKEEAEVEKKKLESTSHLRVFEEPNRQIVSSRLEQESESPITTTDEESTAPQPQRHQDNNTSRLSAGNSPNPEPELTTDNFQMLRRAGNGEARKQEIDKESYTKVSTSDIRLFAQLSRHIAASTSETRNPEFESHAQSKQQDQTKNAIPFYFSNNAEHGKSYIVNKKIPTFRTKPKDKNDESLLLNKQQIETLQKMEEKITNIGQTYKFGYQSIKKIKVPITTAEDVSMIPDASQSKHIPDRKSRRPIRRKRNTSRALFDNFLLPLAESEEEGAEDRPSVSSVNKVLSLPVVMSDKWSAEDLSSVSSGDIDSPLPGVESDEENTENRRSVSLGEIDSPVSTIEEEKLNVRQKVKVIEEKKEIYIRESTSKVLLFEKPRQFATANDTSQNIESESSICSKQQNKPTQSRKSLKSKIKRKSAMQVTPLNPAFQEQLQADDQDTLLCLLEVTRILSKSLLRSRRQDHITHNTTRLPASEKEKEVETEQKKGDKVEQERDEKKSSTQIVTHSGETRFLESKSPIHSKQKDSTLNLESSETKNERKYEMSGKNPENTLSCLGTGKHKDSESVSTLSQTQSFVTKGENNKDKVNVKQKEEEKETDARQNITGMHVLNVPETPHFGEARYLESNSLIRSGRQDQQTQTCESSETKTERESEMSFSSLKSAEAGQPKRELEKTEKTEEAKENCTGGTSDIRIIKVPITHFVLTDETLYMEYQSTQDRESTKTKAQEKFLIPNPSLSVDNFTAEPCDIGIQSPVSLCNKSITQFTSHTSKSHSSNCQVIQKSKSSETKPQEDSALQGQPFLFGKSSAEPCNSRAQLHSKSVPVPNTPVAHFSSDIHKTLYPCYQSINESELPILDPPQLFGNVSTELCDCRTKLHSHSTPLYNMPITQYASDISKSYIQTEKETPIIDPPLLFEKIPAAPRYSRTQLYSKTDPSSQTMIHSMCRPSSIDYQSPQERKSPDIKIEKAFPIPGPSFLFENISPEPHDSESQVHLKPDPVFNMPVSQYAPYSSESLIFGYRTTQESKSSVIRNEVDFPILEPPIMFGKCSTEPYDLQTHLRSKPVPVPNKPNTEFVPYTGESRYLSPKPDQVMIHNSRPSESKNNKPEVKVRQEGYSPKPTRGYSGSGKDKSPIRCSQQDPPTQFRESSETKMEKESAVPFSPANPAGPGKPHTDDKETLLLVAKEILVLLAKLTGNTSENTKSCPDARKDNSESVFAASETKSSTREDEKKVEGKEQERNEESFNKESTLDIRKPITHALGNKSADIKREDQFQIPDSPCLPRKYPNESCDSNTQQLSKPVPAHNENRPSGSKDSEPTEQCRQEERLPKPTNKQPGRGKSKKQKSRIRRKRQDKRLRTSNLTRSVKLQTDNKLLISKTAESTSGSCGAGIRKCSKFTAGKLNLSTKEGEKNKGQSKSNVPDHQSHLLISSTSNQHRLHFDDFLLPVQGKNEEGAEDCNSVSSGDQASPVKKEENIEHTYKQESIRYSKNLLPQWENTPVIRQMPRVMSISKPGSSSSVNSMDLVELPPLPPLPPSATPHPPLMYEKFSADPCHSQIHPESKPFPVKNWTLPNPNQDNQPGTNLDTLLQPVYETNEWNSEDLDNLDSVSTREVNSSSKMPRWRYTHEVERYESFSEYSDIAYSENTMDPPSCDGGRHRLSTCSTPRLRNENNSGSDPSVYSEDDIVDTQ